MYGLTNVKSEMTGGGCYTFWGKAKEYYFLCNIEGIISLYDADTDEYMNKVFNDEDFDAYEWEQEHLVDVKIDNRQFLIEMFDALEDNFETKILRQSYLEED